MLLIGDETEIESELNGLSLHKISLSGRAWFVLHGPGRGVIRIVRGKGVLFFHPQEQVVRLIRVKARIARKILYTMLLFSFCLRVFESYLWSKMWDLAPKVGPFGH